MKVYVVTEPRSIAGIYETWAECRAAMKGVPGLRHYQATATREIAEAMLEGTGVCLPPGDYAFTDGNADGGVGVVLVRERDGDTRSWTQVSTTVASVFRDDALRHLASRLEIADSLRKKRNELAELAALYHVLREAEPSSGFTVVHDYHGVAAYLDGRWKKMSRIVESIVAASRRLLQDRWPEPPSFRYQPAHQSTLCGRDDYAHWNNLADKLATRAADPASRGVRKGFGPP